MRCIIIGRPHKFRKISNIKPKFTSYNPRGMDPTQVDKIFLSMEEFEALRLRHYEDLKQVDAAEKMLISQTTYSRILSKAYKKITKALVEGFGLDIQTHVSTQKGRQFRHRKGLKASDQEAGDVGVDHTISNESKVVFKGYGCLNCGYTFSSENNSETSSSNQKSTEDPSVEKSKMKILCPECNSPKTYRLIKKLSPES